MSKNTEGCCQYCEHNWDSECNCQPCQFIREVGFQHEPNCKRILARQWKAFEELRIIEDELNEEES